MIEKQAVKRLLKAWHRVDMDVRDFTYIEAELARGRLLVLNNKHWSSLGSMVIDIANVLKSL